MSSGNAVQDYYMVLLGIDSVMNKISGDFPAVEKVILQSGNVKCYQSALVIKSIMEINK